MHINALYHSTLRDELQHRENIYQELTEERAHSQQLEHDLMQMRHKLEDYEQQQYENSYENPRIG